MAIQSSNCCRVGHAAMGLSQSTCALQAPIPRLRWLIRCPATYGGSESAMWQCGSTILARAARRLPTPAGCWCMYGRLASRYANVLCASRHMLLLLGCASALRAQAAQTDSTVLTGSCPSRAANAVNWDEVLTAPDVPARPTRESMGFQPPNMRTPREQDPGPT